jgi:hypothetical protein
MGGFTAQKFMQAEAASLRDLTQVLGRMDKSRYLSDAWRDYRRRVRWFFGALTLAPLAGVLLVWAAKHQPSGVAIAAYVAVVAWLAALTVVTARLQFFPCPNCGKPFAFRHLNNLPLLVSACVHCGSPKWEG